MIEPNKISDEARLAAKQESNAPIGHVWGTFVQQLLNAETLTLAKEVQVLNRTIEELNAETEKLRKEILEECARTCDWKIVCLGEDIHPAAKRVLEELKVHILAMPPKLEPSQLG